MSAPSRSEKDEGFDIGLAVAEAAIEQVRAALMDYLDDCALSARTANRVEVVLEELVSNVVRHSCEAGHLRVTAGHDDAGVNITVEDDGVAFNPLDAPEPAPYASVDTAMLGGKGIELVRRLSTDFRYERRGSRNHVSVTIATS